VDGVRVFTAEGIAWRTSPDLRVNQAGVYLFIHNNPARTTNVLDVDNVVFSRSYIGPAECEPGVAIQTVCRCGGAPDPDSAARVHASGFCCDGAWSAVPCGAPTPVPSGTTTPTPLPSSAPTSTPALTPEDVRNLLFLPNVLG
jgi:hypothetical protein